MIELLVAATILAVLTTIGVVSFTAANQRARDGKRKADLEAVRSALELYRVEIGIYPTGDYGQMTTTLIGLDVLASPAPLDPQPDRYAYTYNRLTNTTYSLCAELENPPNPPDTTYCVFNP